MRNLRQYHSVTQEIVCGRAKHDRPLTCHNWESSPPVQRVVNPSSRVESRDLPYRSSDRKSLHFIMARTKQTPDPPEAMPEVLAFATRGANIIKDRLLEMEIIQSDEQMCEYLSLKYKLARTTRNGIKYLEELLNSSEPTTSLENTQRITTGLEAMRKELSTVLGEIPLIICPVKNCPTHKNNGTKNDNYVAESSKCNDNSSNEQNNDSHNNKKKSPRKTPSNHNKNKPDNSQSKKKRAGQENFLTPTKFARKNNRDTH
ncbi:uncharacterized protein TNCV_262131 [Trichonephila clavipes]|nr:uncharacterized protein TNCV_262131 [Trichonephila clavipes]